MRPIRRRFVLQAAAVTSIASYAGGRSLSPAHASPVPAGGTTPPPHGDREPAGTEVRTVDDTGVVFQYAAVVPSFDGWRTHEPTRAYRELDGPGGSASTPGPQARRRAGTGRTTTTPAGTRSPYRRHGT